MDEDESGAAAAAGGVASESGDKREPSGVVEGNIKPGSSRKRSGSGSSSARQRGAAVAKRSKSKKRADPSPAEEQQQQADDGDEDDEECPACEAARASGRGNKDSSDTVSWLQCEECERWFHFGCIILEKASSTEDVEQYYCDECVERSKADPAREQPLAVKVKEPARKSTRKRNEVSYQKSTARASAAGTANPWFAVAESRPLVRDAFPPMRAPDMTVDWLEKDPKAFTEPIFIPSPEGLQMRVLPEDIRISSIAQAVGPDMPLDVIDVASQSGLSNWTVGKWASYYEDPAREKVRNVISLELSSTPLKDYVEAPKIVRDIDWVEQFWPKDLMAKDIYPQVIRYCLMSPAQSWTDWHIDFSASSVFYHILRGSKVFYFIRPTAENLRKYEKWSGTSQQLGIWLGDECDKVYKVELQPGNTMIIPSGWIHCVYTPADALVIGGNFLHSYNIAAQLRVYQIELNTKVPKKFRFPYFVTLLWHVGHTYLQRLQKPKHGICVRILRGLKALSAFLVEQAWRMTEEADVSAERRRVAKENVPWDVVSDPENTAKALQAKVHRLLGDKLPKLAKGAHPTFDAQDFLDDGNQAVQQQQQQEGTPKSKGNKKAALSRADSNGPSPARRQNGSATPAAAAAESPTSQDHRSSSSFLPNGFSSNGANQQRSFGHGTSNHLEQIVRSNPPPVITTRIESRERPLAPTINFDEDASSSSSSSKRIMQDCEVKLTSSESMLKKTLPGPEEGTWIVETRKVITTIERVFYPALPAEAASSSSSSPPLLKTTVKPEPDQSSMDVDGDFSAGTESGNALANEEDRAKLLREEEGQAGTLNGEHVTAVMANGHSESVSGPISPPNDIPRDEISRMLNLAQFSGLPTV